VLSWCRVSASRTEDAPGLERLGCPFGKEARAKLPEIDWASPFPSHRMRGMHLPLGLQMQQQATDTSSVQVQGSRQFGAGLGAVLERREKAGEVFLGLVNLVGARKPLYPQVRGTQDKGGSSWYSSRPQRHPW